MHFVSQLVLRVSRTVLLRTVRVLVVLIERAQLPLLLQFGLNTICEQIGLGAVVVERRVVAHRIEVWHLIVVLV